LFGRGCPPADESRSDPTFPSTIGAALPHSWSDHVLRAHVQPAGRDLATVRRLAHHWTRHLFLLRQRPQPLAKRDRYGNKGRRTTAYHQDVDRLVLRLWRSRPEPGHGRGNL